MPNRRTPWSEVDLIDMKNHLDQGCGRSKLNAPLARERQIELMRDADKRIEARVKGWLRDRTFRSVVCKPSLDVPA